MGVDLIALLAMAGALALPGYLPGAVVALLFSGGQTLEVCADGQARHELSMLAHRAPRTADRRQCLDSSRSRWARPTEPHPSQSGRGGPMDGRLAEPVAVLYEAVLAGEATPLERRSGDRIPRAPSTQVDRLRCARWHPPRKSTYEQIVRMTRERYRLAAIANFGLPKEKG